MKDDSREIPPPRVWGAEGYNKSDVRIRAERMAAKTVAALRSLVRVVFWPFLLLGRGIATVYWGVPKEPRCILGAVCGCLLVVWSFAAGGHLLGFGSADKYRWWEFPYLMSAVVFCVVSALLCGVAAVLTKEEWKKGIKN